MATFAATTFSNPVLDSLFRDSSSYSTTAVPLGSLAAYYSGGLAGTLTPLSWGAPSDGVMACTNGTLSNSNFPQTYVSARLYGQLTTHSAPAVTLTPGIAGSGEECIFNTLSATSSSSNSLQDLRIKVPKTFGTASLNTAARNAICEILRGGSNQSWASGDIAKAGYGETANACVLTLYGGTIPADADQAAATVLGAYTVPDATNLFAAASGGAIALASTIPVPITGTGTITHFRLSKSSPTYGTLVFQGTAGTSGTDAIVASTAAGGSGTIDLTALTFNLVP